MEGEFFTLFSCLIFRHKQIKQIYLRHAFMSKRKKTTTKGKLHETLQVRQVAKEKNIPGFFSDFCCGLKRL
jgi:hypothetical protein